MDTAVASTIPSTQDIPETRGFLRRTKKKNVSKQTGYRPLQLARLQALLVASAPRLLQCVTYWTFHKTTEGG
jgi:hypothetical protein